MAKSGNLFGKHNVRPLATRESIVARLNSAGTVRQLLKALAPKAHEPLSAKERFSQLEELVVQACHGAANYDVNRDTHAQTRKEYERYIKSIRPHLKTLTKLIRFARDFEDLVPFTFRDFADAKLRTASLAPPRELPHHLFLAYEKALHRSLADWNEAQRVPRLKAPRTDFTLNADAALRATAGLRRRSQTAAVRARNPGLGPSEPWYQIGPLLFSNAIDRSVAGTLRTATTGLLFQLTYYFRRYSAGLETNVPSDLGWPMPACGRPYWAVSAALIEAALDQTHTPQALERRLSKLLAKDDAVCFVGWADEAYTSDPD